MIGQKKGTHRGGPTPEFRRHAPARRRLPWAILAALVLIAAVVIAVWRVLPDRVATTAVTRRDVARTLVLTGRVRPTSRPQVGTTIAGTVREVLVREGDHVNRGQLLLRIDDAQPVAALAQARAALATSAARTRSTLDQARLSAQSTRRDAERARTLFAQGAISQRDRDEAERVAASAAAELSAASARDGAAAASTLAEISRARAAVASAEALLALTSVRSPASATVLTRSVDPGDAVLPGQLLMELGVDGATELVAFAREENLADLLTGLSAVASADAFPDSTFAARVSWLAPVVDPRQGTVEVRLTVPKPPSYLRADMTISINVEVEHRVGALVVPRALVGGIGTATPWVIVERDGRAFRQAVRLGILGDRDAEVIGGLKETDRVLPSGTPPGSRVDVSTFINSASQAPISPSR
jgi:HlyD family secretion protein